MIAPENETEQNLDLLQVRESASQTPAICEPEEEPQVKLFSKQMKVKVPLSRSKLSLKSIERVRRNIHMERRKSEFEVQPRNKSTGERPSQEYTDLRVSDF